MNLTISATIHIAPGTKSINQIRVDIYKSPVILYKDQKHVQGIQTALFESLKTSKCKTTTLAKPKVLGLVTVETTPTP